MTIIGLTGGTGAGKGEVCRAFLSLGVGSIDTDKISREVTKRGSKCLAELTEAFTGEILTENGDLDRKKLAEIAFSDPEKLKLLNKITHRHILSRCFELINGMAKAGGEAVILDAPLLFESGADKSCDFVVGVTAEREKRIERIIERDSLTRSEAEKRMANQKSDEFFRENCDFLIENNGSCGELFEKIQNLYGKIREKIDKK